MRTYCTHVQYMQAHKETGNTQAHTLSLAWGSDSEV